MAASRRTLRPSQSRFRLAPLNKGDAMRNLRGSLLAGLGLMLAAGALPAGAQPVPGRVRPPPPLMEPVWSLLGECYPIDFTDVDIEWYGGGRVYQLTVSGIKLYANMEVSLSHEAYSGRPDFWRTLVIGCVKNGLVLPLATPYYVTMDLDQFVGRKGIEIVGASRKVRRDVPRS